MFTAGGFLSRVWGGLSTVAFNSGGRTEHPGQAPQVVPAGSLTPSGMQVKDKKTKQNKKRQSKTHKH